MDQQPMRGLRRSLAAMLLLASFGVTNAHAGTKPALFNADTLSPRLRARWQRAVARARASDANPFAALAAVRGRLAALDAARRGDVIVVLPMLERLGPERFWPLVNELIDGRPDPSLPQRAWHDWQIGLIEALGRLRDRRSEPLWLALLATDGGDPGLLRAAAEGAARLGSPATTARLVALAEGAGQRPVVEGMGECRQRACIVTLSQLLARADDDKAALVARSLGRAASSWAWQTPSLVATGEGPALRALAAQALVDRLVAPSLQASRREAMAQALQMVAAPQTKELLENALPTAPAAAIPEVRRLLDRLARSGR